MKKSLIGIIIGVVLGVSVLYLLINYKKNNTSLSADSTSIANAPIAESLLEEETQETEKAVEDYSDYRREIITDLSDVLKTFIPDGYSCIDTAFGDLNLDQYQDVVLVLKKDDEHALSDTAPKRPLLILIGQDNQFQLADQNDNVVENLNSYGPEDPFKRVKIKNGYFSVEHSNGGNHDWYETIITFKYSKEKNTWLLHKAGQVSYHTISSDSTEEYEDIQTIKDFGEITFHNYDSNEIKFNPE